MHTTRYQHGFIELLELLGLKASDCPVVLSTRDAALKAVGHTLDSKNQDRTLRLATAITAFHSTATGNTRQACLEAVHDISLELGGGRGGNTYHQHVLALGVKPEEWRPAILQLCQELRYDVDSDKDVEGWLQRARVTLSPLLLESGASINRLLKANSKLAATLTAQPLNGLSAQTIHSVKGTQFRGTCLVLSVAKCKDTLDYLATGYPGTSAEESRKAYVAASRAERLLVIAAPKSQRQRLYYIMKRRRSCKHSRSLIAGCLSKWGIPKHDISTPKCQHDTRLR